MFDKTLIFGANGQVGSAIASLVPGSIALDFEDGDFSKPGAIVDLLEKFKPDIVFNAAAYTRVERAESEEELALLINARTPGATAKWCAGHGACFIHFSTDYVFGGDGARPWTEDDQIKPPNAYGRTKAEGERDVLAAGGNFLIFRTSWVYDWKGKNFLMTMLKLGKEKETLRVVDDQFGAPTFAVHLAEGAVRAVERSKSMPRFPSGIYHLCNRGETTWFGFAMAIFDAAARRSIPLKVKRVEAITTKECGGAVRRPKNSRLNTEKAMRVFGIELPAWEAGLSACMEHLK